MKKQLFTVFIASLFLNIACQKEATLATYQIAECWLNDSLVFIPSKDTTDLYINTKKSTSFAIKNNAPANTVKTYCRLFGTSTYINLTHLLIDSTTKGFDLYIGDEKQVHDRRTITINRFKNTALNNLQQTGTIMNRGAKFILHNTARGYFHTFIYNRWGELKKDSIVFKTTDSLIVPIPSIQIHEPVGVYVMLCNLGGSQKTFMMTKIE